jgi:hypothetical protein
MQLVSEFRGREADHLALPKAGFICVDPYNNAPCTSLLHNTAGQESFTFT